MRNKKNKYLLFLVFVIIFIFWGNGIVHALGLEVKDYPSLPGLITPSASCTGNDCISIYVAYWFGVLVYLAGALALISFAVGAVGLINPNVEAHKDAKDRMKGAILGLLLTVASFIILKTINPELITPALAPLSPVEGVYYTNGSGELKPCPAANEDTSTIPPGFYNIKYVCSAPTAPALLVWLFPGKSFAPLEGASVKRVTCGQTIPISGGSFHIAEETPGVYYCLGGCGGDNMCQGYMSDATLGSQNIIGDPFYGNMRGVRIVNDPVNKLYYGVIFHKEIGLENGGVCTLPEINESSYSLCKNVPAGVSSAVDIFALNKNPLTSGDGVAFYSKPWGVDTGGNAGFYSVPNWKIYPPIFFMDSTKMIFNYTGINAVTETYKSACKTFQDCPGSIKIKGSYLVALYDESTFYCQTFNQDVNNLNVQQIIAKEPTLAQQIWANKLGPVYIIPTQ